VALEPRFLERKIPPPVVALLCGAAMWLLAAHTPPLEIPKTLRIVTAALIGAAGLLVMAAGAIEFLRAGTTFHPMRPQTATVLVTTGIFRFTRNPMYLGDVLLLLAWAILLSSPLALLGALAFWLYIGRFQIRPEEEALRTLFGTAYAEYTSKVPRWI
jgi:protein-S-isoprenylcysteine O-methyltransferase Ste14